MLMFPQMMCVLMVCFNVLELLLDETAMPRGMEVRTLVRKTSCSVCHSQSSVFTDDCYFCVCVSVLGPSPGDGLLLHVWLTRRCSSSSPYPVSFFFFFFNSRLCVYMCVCICVYAEFTCHHLAVTHPPTDLLIFDQDVMLTHTVALMY